jgi:tetratricopeptide (TPR) repeat protein
VADDLVKVMAMQVTHAPPPFAQTPAAADVPGAVEAAVMKALEKDRARRHQSASEFREALERAGARSAGAVWLARGAAAGGRALGSARAAYGRLPWTVRRWTPLAGVLAVIAALALLPMVCRHEGAAPTARPPAPKPVEPALKAPIKKIEDAIATGRLTEARVLILQQVSEHPDNARVRYLLGNLEFGERNAAAGLAAYEEALRLDPGLRADAALLMNVRNTLPDRTRGREALDLLVKRVGKPAAGVLADVASEDRRAEFRAVARAACATLGCADKVDSVHSYALDLQQARTCEEKREAVQRLAATRDPRALEPLKRAMRNSGSGVLSRILGGGCAHRELQAAIKELGG